MNTNQSQQSKGKAKFNSVYDRRARASLEDARAEAEALSKAIKRISDSAPNGSNLAQQNLAAGKLFEIANELPSAEIAYRQTRCCRAAIA